MLGRLLVRAFVCALIAAYFLYWTWDGLFVYFHLDDMMNLHRAWLVPFPKLVLACFNPFTFETRPTGGVLYRIVFHFAGLDPLPFRVVSYILMLANLGLFAGLTWRVTKSAEIAAIGTAIAAFHPRLADIYSNNGTIYDLLSTALLLSALIFYIAIRDRGESVTGWRLAAFGALAALAVNAKEMAAVLPLLIAAYELTRYRTIGNGGRAALGVSLAIMMAGVISRIVPGGPFHGNEGYKLHIGIGHAWRSWRALSGEMFFWPEPLPAAGAIAAFAALLAIALLFRRRGAAFFALFAAITPIPVIFIPYRGFFVMYMPLLGWAVCVAIVLVAARDWLRKALWRREPPAPGLKPEAIAMLVWVVQGLTALYVFFPMSPSIETLGANSEVRRMKEQMAALYPSLPAGSRLLFVNDEFGANEWTPVFILHLLYRNPELEVDRLKMMPNGCADARRYTHVLADDGGQIRLVPPEYVTSRVPACGGNGG